jgi:hypothetical protein
MIELAVDKEVFSAILDADRNDYHVTSETKQRLAETIRAVRFHLLGALRLFVAWIGGLNTLEVLNDL